MPDSTPQVLTIDVVSDAICPWCYIGKRRLRAALDQLAERDPALRPVVRWHPFQLNPGMPPQGMDRRAYLEAKFGGAAGAAQVYERIAAVGDNVGIAFAFDRIARVPNTVDAHRLIAWGQAQGDGDSLVEALFRAFFIDGRDVGEREVLAALATDAGLDAGAARDYLASTQGVADIAAADRRARELSIGGVPFFIFGQRVAVSGAQEPSTLLGAIDEAQRARAD